MDFSYWHWGTLALAGTAHWKSWSDRLIVALLDRQNRSGCRSGSWEPADRWSDEGGRVYATAINALTLEVYYRHAR